MADDKPGLQSVPSEAKPEPEAPNQLRTLSHQHAATYLRACARETAALDELLADATKKENAGVAIACLAAKAEIKMWATRHAISSLLENSTRRPDA